MRRRALMYVTTTISAMGPPAAAAAQLPVRVGAAGGLTPVAHGNWDRGYGGGAHGVLSIERERALGRLGLRADAFVHGFRRDTFGGALSRRTSVPGVSASVVLPLVSAAARLQPYVIAGGGSYRTEYGGGPPEWHFGLSGGGGLRYSARPVGLFVEARLHQVHDGSTPRMVPVSVGLRF